jgi:hypothetical protein
MSTPPSFSQQTVEPERKPAMVYSPSLSDLNSMPVSTAVPGSGNLTLGFLPRWRQRQVAMADSDPLAIPTVSVLSPSPEKGTGPR